MLLMISDANQVLVMENDESRDGSKGVTSFWVVTSCSHDVVVVTICSHDIGMVNFKTWSPSIFYLGFIIYTSFY